MYRQPVQAWNWFVALFVWGLRRAGRSVAGKKYRRGVWATSCSLVRSSSYNSYNLQLLFPAMELPCSYVATYEWPPRLTSAQLPAGRFERMWRPLTRASRQQLKDRPARPPPPQYLSTRLPTPASLTLGPQLSNDTAGRKLEFILQFHRCLGRFASHAYRFFIGPFCKTLGHQSLTSIGLCSSSLIDVTLMHKTKIALGTDPTPCQSTLDAFCNILVMKLLFR